MTEAERARIRAQMVADVLVAYVAMTKATGYTMAETATNAVRIFDLHVKESVTKPGEGDSK